MIVILFLFVSLEAFSQQFKFKFEGSFQTTATPSAINPTMVNYSMNWNESGTEIQGIYQDNYFARNAPQLLTGTISSSGKKFTIIFSESSNGVKQIYFTTPHPESLSGSISLTAFTMDQLGRTVDRWPGFALMTTRLSSDYGGPTNDENACTVGFGALTGFCGIYSGIFSEIIDPQNRCDLLTGNPPRLELSADTVFRIYINYVPGNPNPQLHNIGAFIPSPTSNTINVTRRDCGQLPGTSFSPGNCRTLNLSGLFFDQISEISFVGTYSITDDMNGEFCSYSLSLKREVVY